MSLSHWKLCKEHAYRLLKHNENTTHGDTITIVEDGTCFDCLEDAEAEKEGPF